MKYIVYNTGSISRIVRQGDCPEENIPLKARAGETALALPDVWDDVTGDWILNDVDINTHYVLAGVPTLYTVGELAIKAGEMPLREFDVSTMTLVDTRNIFQMRRNFRTKFMKRREELYVADITSAAGTFPCSDYDREHYFQVTKQLQILDGRGTPTTAIIVDNTDAEITMDVTDMEDLCLAISTARETARAREVNRRAAVDAALDLATLEALSY
jgi:hypothetical protein